MKALIDTNVLMDFVDDRIEFINAAEMVFTICSDGRTDGYVSAHSLMDICYLVRKKKTQQERNKGISETLNHFAGVRTGNNSVRSLLKKSLSFAAFFASSPRLFSHR